MRVGDDELDAAQAPTGELAQEGGPERLGLGGADIHTEHLAPPIGVDAKMRLGSACGTVLVDACQSFAFLGRPLPTKPVLTALNETKPATAALF
jgi:hypothetical protein